MNLRRDMAQSTQAANKHVLIIPDWVLANYRSVGRGDHSIAEDKVLLLFNAQCQPTERNILTNRRFCCQ